MFPIGAFDLVLPGKSSAGTEPSIPGGRRNHNPQTCDWGAGGAGKGPSALLSRQLSGHERKPVLWVLDSRGGTRSHEGRFQHRHPHLTPRCEGVDRVPAGVCGTGVGTSPAQRPYLVSAGILPQGPIRGQPWRNVIQWGPVSLLVTSKGPGVLRWAAQAVQSPPPTVNYSPFYTLAI